MEKWPENYLNGIQRTFDRGALHIFSKLLPKVEVITCFFRLNPLTKFCGRLIPGLIVPLLNQSITGSIDRSSSALRKRSGRSIDVDFSIT